LRSFSLDNEEDGKDAVVVDVVRDGESIARKEFTGVLDSSRVTNSLRDRDVILWEKSAWAKLHPVTMEYPSMGMIPVKPK
jgi:hypothetical protein